MRNHEVIKAIGYKMQSAFNGLILDKGYHRSSHPGYTTAIEAALDAIAHDSLSSVTERLKAADRVKTLVTAAKALLIDQNPLYLRELRHHLGRRVRKEDLEEHWIAELKKQGVEFN